MTQQCYPRVHATGHTEVRHLESYDIYKRNLTGITLEEKILRTGATPTYGNNGQPKGNLQDSSLRLRWPKANDRRRAIVVELPTNGTTGHTYTSECRFVHMSPRDVEMHYRLTASEALAER